MGATREKPLVLKEQELKAGKILRNKRRDLGYTQREIADKLQTDRTNYCRKESGKVAMTAGEFLFILDTLQTLPRKSKGPSISDLIEKL